MACSNELEGKRPSKGKRIFKGLCLSLLLVGTGVAIYDHRAELLSRAKKTAEFAKAGVSRVKALIDKKH